MQIRLVPPSVWTPELERATRTSPNDRHSAARARLTSAVLWTLQDAHVGITPALAAQLATLMTQPESARSSVWAAVLRGLQGALSASGTAGITASANPAYFLLKVVKPLVREATLRCGESHLLCRDEIASPVTAAKYRDYGQRLERALATGAEDEHRNRLFYLEHGSAMSTFSAPGGAHPRGRMPEVDRLAAAVLFGLPTDIAAEAWQPRQAPSPTFVPRSRPSPGAQEQRVEGVRHSRREADLGAMILSEYLAPPAVLAERVASSGFWIYERRPLRDRLRDALVVGVMPNEVRATVGGSFVKACWADCMARLGRRLAGARLLQTEFRWIEGDATGGVRQCSFFLHDLRRDAVLEPSHEAFRPKFLASLRWLPDYLEVHAGFEPRATPMNPDPRAWAIGAWRAQRDHPQWTSRPVADPAPAGNFSFVHVMVCLPGASAGGERSLSEARGLGRLRAELGLGYHPRRNVSVTYAGEDPASRSWGVASSAAPYLELGGPTARLADQLESVWLEQLTREIWHA